VVNWRRREPGVAGPSRVGFVTSRRIGGAVARNRARRLMREAYRLNQHALQAPVDLVLVARASVVTMPLEGVCNDLRRALRGSGLLKPSPGPA
jgi:ribonuclease P protein component